MIGSQAAQRLRNWNPGSASAVAPAPAANAMAAAPPVNQQRWLPGMNAANALRAGGQFSPPATFKSPSIAPARTPPPATPAGNLLRTSTLGRDGDDNWASAWTGRNPGPDNLVWGPDIGGRINPTGATYKRNWKGLGEGANQNLVKGRSVYGHAITPDTWINPAFDPDRYLGGYTRFDHSQRGSGAERALTFADGASIFRQYQKGGTDNARRMIDTLEANTGSRDWQNATDEELFDALDMTFRGYQEDNQKENFKLGIGSLVPTAIGLGVGAAAGNPWAGRAVSAGISGGKKAFG